MLYIFKNPRVRRNPNRRPLDETLRAALITDASQRRLLSRFPGIVNAAAGFPAKDYARFEKSMKSVEALLTSSPFYKAPVDRSTGKPFEYRPYQIAGITFMLSRRGRGLIMDPMGLGKTLQGIGLLVAGGASPRTAVPGDTPYLPALIVCPNSARPSWRKDIRDWTQGIEVQEPQGPKGIARAIRNVPRGTPLVIIVSKDSFKKAVFDEELTEAELSAFQTLIVDESHYVKNAASQVTKAVQKAAASIDHVLLLTGTPVLNAPGELYAQLQLVQPKSDVPNWQTVDQRGVRDMEESAIASWSGTTTNQLRRTRTGFATFRTWDDEKSGRLQDYLRERGARRSRSDYIRSGGRLYKGDNLPNDMRKIRNYNIVPLPPDVVTTLLARWNTYTPGPGDRDEDLADFQNRLANMEGWFRQVERRFQNQSPYEMKRTRPDLYEKNVEELTKILNAALLRGHMPIPTSVRIQSALASVPDVVSYIQRKRRKAKVARPTIVFAYHDNVRDALVNALDEGGVRNVYWAQASDAIYKGPGKSNRVAKTNAAKEQYAFDWLTQRYKSQDTIKNLSNADKSAVIVLGVAGTEGLNLAAADEVIFAERFFNPGKEWQAEDRINRPDQITPPRITYMVPLEPFSLAYSNRLEQKRNSIYRTLGEPPTADYSRPLDSKELVQALRLNQDAMIDPNASPQEKRLARLIMAAFLAELNPTQFLQDELDRLSVLPTTPVRRPRPVSPAGSDGTPDARATAMEVWSEFARRATYRDPESSRRAMERLSTERPEKYGQLVQSFFDDQLALDVEVQPVDSRAVDAALQSGNEVVFVGYPVGLFTVQSDRSLSGDKIRKRPFGATGVPQEVILDRSDWMLALTAPHTGMVTIEGRPLTRDEIEEEADPDDYNEYLKEHIKSGSVKKPYMLALNPRRKKNMARSRRSGKYAAVWNKYGQKGFGIPTKAPHVGSYPLYPIGRARYALVLIASPSYDKKKGERAQIAKRALAAHPSLKSFWGERQETIKARLGRGGSRRMAANPKRKRKKEERGFFGGQPGGSGWAMSDPDAAPTAYYRQRKTVLVLLHTNRNGEGVEMVYRIPVDMTGMPKENERGYKTKLRQAIRAQIPELRTNQEVRDAGLGGMSMDTFQSLKRRFAAIERSGWKGYTDPSDYIRDRLPGVTPATSDAVVLAIRDAMTQGSWDDHWSAPVSAYRKASRRRNPAESWRYTIRYMDPGDRTSTQYESFRTTKPPEMWLREAAREGNDQYADNFRIRDAGVYVTEYIDGNGRQWFISIVAIS